MPNISTYGHKWSFKTTQLLTPTVCLHIEGWGQTGRDGESPLNQERSAEVGKSTQPADVPSRDRMTSAHAEIHKHTHTHTLH